LAFFAGSENLDNTDQALVLELYHQQSFWDGSGNISRRAALDV
jgi:hypothetical protein